MICYLKEDQAGFPLRRLSNAEMLSETLPSFFALLGHLCPMSDLCRPVEGWVKVISGLIERRRVTLAVLACGRQAEFLESDRLKDGAALPKLPSQGFPRQQSKNLANADACNAQGFAPICNR